MIEASGLILERSQYEVEASVAVVVAPIDSHARLFASILIQCRGARGTYVFEFPITQIMVQVARQRIVRNIEIHLAVVIKIRERYSEIISVTGRKFRRHINKPPISKVAVDA